MYGTLTNFSDIFTVYRVHSATAIIVEITTRDANAGAHLDILLTLHFLLGSCYSREVQLPAAATMVVESTTRDASAGAHEDILLALLIRSCSRREMQLPSRHHLWCLLWDEALLVQNQRKEALH